VVAAVAAHLLPDCSSIGRACDCRQRRNHRVAGSIPANRIFFDKTGGKENDTCAIRDLQVRKQVRLAIIKVNAFSYLNFAYLNFGQP
jgi:hypothetical protein